MFLEVQCLAHAYREDSVGRENPPCMPHRFFNRDYSLITTVETSYQYHVNKKKKNKSIIRFIIDYRFIIGLLIKTTNQSC
jgi:hypothetical protein